MASNPVQSPTSPTGTHASLPSRSATQYSTGTDGDDAIPDDDASETTKLFNERLQAWKHACGYLEDYIKASEKSEADAAKDYEKVLKTVNNPLKEGHHFQQENGGVAGIFDNIRANTQAIANSHNETAKALKGSVLPTFERLHTEVKNKTKELDKGAGKASKAVEKSRATSQKHIEALGQHAASFDSRGGNAKASEDPYLIQRQVYHRLNKQVIDENNNREDTIAVQNQFQSFETHIIRTIQQGLSQFHQVMANQADQTRNMYGDISATASRMPADFEWNGFIRRNNHILIDPNGPKRSLENITFANQDHPSTRPLIAGSLERRGKLLKKYETGYFVVTPSKYLHEFKSDDDFARDPSPETSLYLPDCLIGAVDGTKFNIKGKDASGSSIQAKMSMSHEYGYKAHTPDDARKWHDVIAAVSGGTTSAAPPSPSSPAMTKSDTFRSTSDGSQAASPSTMTSGTTHHAEERQMPQEHQRPQEPLHQTDLAGNTVAPSDEKRNFSGPTGGQTDSAKMNDYAPL